MANFFAGVPFIYETPSESAARNAQTGSQLGRNFVDAYLGAKRQALDERQYDEAAEMRKAQTASLLTAMEANKIRTQVSLQAMNRQNAQLSKIGDAMAVENEWSRSGYDTPEVSEQFNNFLRANPEMYDSEWANGVRTKIGNAVKAATEATESRLDRESRERIAGLRRTSGGRLTPPQEAAMKAEFDAAAGDPDEIERVYRKWQSVLETESGEDGDMGLEMMDNPDGSRTVNMPGGMSFRILPQKPRTGGASGTW